jgi:hypothetical protein
MSRLKLLKLTILCLIFSTLIKAQVGIGTTAPAGAEILFDGTRTMLDEKWTYWQGPRFKSSLPIKWEIMPDPVDKGTTVSTSDPAAAGGLYGAADIVTKKKFKDCRLHVEFFITAAGGNSGVYLQNRYEIQVFDGDTTSHGMGAVLNITPSPYKVYNGIGKWNSYDILFRAARFKKGKKTENALVTVYFNGQKVHTNIPIHKVFGGPNSGVDGGNNKGEGITNTKEGLKLQAEGHDVRYRNIWIKPMKIKKADTDF